MCEERQWAGTRERAERHHVDGLKMVQHTFRARSLAGYDVAPERGPAI